MRIHHATAKKAEALGVTLVINEDLQTIKATSASGIGFRDDDAKRAVVLCTVADVLKSDYPGIRMLQIGSGEIHVSNSGNDGDDDPFYTVDGGPLDHDNLLADILEAAEEEGIDAEAGLEKADEDEAAARVVVAEHYKREYAERGNRNHCGDWLAKTLQGQFEIAVDGVLRFDADAFTDCLIANGVEMSGKWAALPQSGQKGWVGRYRMNGRQRLEFQVARNGVLQLRGDTVEVPADELAHLRGKHPKAVEVVAEKVENKPATTDKPKRSRKKAA